MNKAFNITRTIFTWLLVAVAVAMMIFTVISVNTFDNTDRSLFGYKAFIVLSDSMSTTDGDETKGYFDAGDLVLVKKVDTAELKVGDIISYTSTNTENYGKTVTHMIRSITTDAQGELGFVTYGTSTNTDDANVVSHQLVHGKYETHIPNVGTFFQFLKTTPGYILCIFLPFLLLIGMQGINSIRLFKKYKAEQLAEIEAERAKERAELDAERLAMAEERKRQDEMMQKLLEMQAALQGNNTGCEVVSAEESRADEK